MAQSVRLIRLLTFKIVFLLSCFNLSSSLPNSQPVDASEAQNPQERNDFFDAVLLKLNAEPYKISIEPKANWSSDENIVYKWTLVGHDDCFVNLKCSEFKLAKDDSDQNECKFQSLVISDGYTGRVEHCGNIPNLSLMPSNGLRDLYLTLESVQGSETPKLECSAVCVQQSDPSLYLPREEVENENVDCNCGRKPLENRIIGGTEARSIEHPWLVAIVRTSTRQPYCIGSLINDRVVLTGAHCFQGRFRKKESSEVVLNAQFMDPMPNVHQSSEKPKYKTYNPEELERLDRGNNTYRYKVDQIIIHPLFNSKLSDYDTAVVILSTPVIPYEGHSTICLPPLIKNSEPELYTGKRGEVAGWGLGSAGRSSNQTHSHLLQIQLDIFSPKGCVPFFKNKIPHPHRVLCAAHRSYEQATCSGDSGGPISVELKKIWYQAGIVSWSYGCGEVGQPIVFYRTTSTNQWIHHVSNLESSVWCQNPEYPYPNNPDT